MHYNLIRDLIRHLDSSGALAVRECDPDLQHEIERLNLPLDLKRILQWSWASKWAEIGKYRIAPVSDILSEEWFDRLLSAQFLSIGSARNGDLLAIRIDSPQCEVGLIDCIELAGDEEVQPSAHYYKICDSLAELLLRLTEGRFLPIDSHAARQLSQLSDEKG